MNGFLTGLSNDVSNHRQPDVLQQVVQASNKEAPHCCYLVGTVMQKRFHVLASSWMWYKFCCRPFNNVYHYDDVMMGAMASQITSLTIVYSTVYSGADQSKHQSSASLAFVWGIHRGPVNSPHKWPVTRKMFPFDDVIMMKRYNNKKLAGDLGLRFP